MKSQIHTKSLSVLIVYDSVRSGKRAKELSVKAILRQLFSARYEPSPVQ